MCPVATVLVVAVGLVAIIAAGWMVLDIFRIDSIRSRAIKRHRSLSDELKRGSLDD